MELSWATKFEGTCTRTKLSTSLCFITSSFSSMPTSASHITRSSSNNYKVALAWKAQLNRRSDMWMDLTFVPDNLVGGKFWTNILYFVIISSLWCNLSILIFHVYNLKELISVINTLYLSAQMGRGLSHWQLSMDKFQPT